jgi:myo-inositol-1(or 4)-monophosphatase
MSRQDDLNRIESALDAAAEAVAPFTPGAIEATLKDGGDPLTAADTAVNAAIEAVLPRPGEGWLSEETADNVERLSCDRTWIVDPIDGTREFIQGIPEWCVSVGLVEQGSPVAGGILSPSAGVRIVGSVETGVTLNGGPVHVTRRDSIAGALVLASRSEVKRGEWDRFFSTEISVRNMGSVAFKLGLVAAGLADATWTLVPKNEWDVAGGAALVRAAGGEVYGLDGLARSFNQPDPLMSGFVATAAGLGEPVKAFLEI